ncbi:hypothetical protein CAEBREN_18316 [Caenorhabditis brenneri]|uniref:Uncharacterized protein n=1 Tax=Caenorhabditis brenneri TaxID=135651 RepID=G0MM25_CAEBE|nr:hypothetical protein CAEBREN_18316 [Caenorhabditis brenneri]
MNESRKMVEEYVVKHLNENSSGWALNIGPVVFRHLPSVRQLAISILCIIFSLIIFPFLWKLGLDEFVENLGTKLNIDEYRAGLTIIPICCVVSLLIASSNIQATKSVIAVGLDNLETSDDRSSMPIRERIDKKLSISECVFNEDKKRIVSLGTPEKQYFELIDRSHLYIMVTNLITTTTELHEEYLRLINISLTQVFPVLGEAIGGIEEFVRNYHENILLIPSIGAINFYQSVINIAVLVTIFITISLTVLMMVGFEFRKKWCQKVVQASVPVTIVSAVLSLLVFIGLIYRICFILLVHQHCEENEFEIFRKANTINISENGLNFPVNYGNVLRKSILENTSLFHLVSENDEHGVPDVINGRKLFQPGAKYNETIEKLTQIVMDEYGKILMDACEKSRKTFETIGKMIEDEKNCTDLGYSEMSLVIVNKTMISACEAAEHLKTHPLDKKLIEETAYEKWTESIHPRKNQSIFYEKTVIDDRNPMQVYMVFENPSKKLRPTILEPMLQMAFLVITVTPNFVMLTIYFIFILPLLMGDTEGSESNRPAPKSGSGSKSSSKSKSASPNDEKSPSSKQIIAV